MAADLPPVPACSIVPTTEGSQMFDVVLHVATALGFALAAASMVLYMLFVDGVL